MNELQSNKKTLDDLEQESELKGSLIKKTSPKIEEDNADDTENVNLITSFREELITIFYESQESFEKQLSFITAGALGLSVGFIKDIVNPFKASGYKGLLGWGWGLLVLTLLLNCISHLLAARYSNSAIKEINENKYDPEKINKRNIKILFINWGTVGIMILGIGLIVSFITYNTLL